MKSFWGGSDGKEFILKRYGVKFGWLPSGCHETVRPSFFNQWTDGVCEKFCKHHNNPNVCSDAASISAAEYLVGNADIVEAGAFSYDLTVGANCIHVPLTAAIDSKTRSPDLFIPEEYRISRDPDEMLVFHAIGNQAIRMESTKNIKGTYYLLEAIDRLRSEGYKIRHLGVEPNTHNNILRYIMAQADVVLDHLVFGRLGATGREGMMLGKPVMTYLIHNPPMPPSPMKTREIPIVQTGIDTVYDVLKDLYHHPEKRVEIGLKGREFVVEWFSTERCADRLTAAYDRVMEGKSLHPQEDWA
jgi:glycosyltransferase involved in cell wall biosynthesis